jgi:hypothetical protein
MRNDQESRIEGRCKRPGFDRSLVQSLKIPIGETV